MDDQIVAVIDNDVESSDSSESIEPARNLLNIIHNRISNMIDNVIVDHNEFDSEHENENENDENENENENVGSSTSESRNFDLNLPTSHSYLGSNLEELRGRTLLDEGIYMNLPLLVKESIVLFPGQTLPLAVFSSTVIDMLSKCIQKNRTFGVVCLQDDKLEPIGTTAEIYEYVHGGPDEGFRVKAKGRQRFQILRLIQGYNELSANVKIVPEISLPHPFFDQRLISLGHQRVKPTTESEYKKQDKVERLESAITHWPAWVYRQYDPDRLACQIRQQLQFIETKGSCIPTDPTDLSFWVAQNLPLNDKERIKLLKYDCAISRLQWELKYLTKDRIIVCCDCKKPIGKQSDIFPMSKEGPQSTFCNSGGFIHDTVTLYKAENLMLSPEPPSAVYSWFPGYAWTIANCNGCGTHMGWKFTVHKDHSLRPSSFWGLTRKSLKFKAIPENAKQLSYSSDEDNVSEEENDI